MKRQTFKTLLITGLLFSFDTVHAQFFNTFETNSGSISLGPANPSFAHIYTDRPKFIFNEDVYSYKGGFSSYSFYNLFLKTNGTTRLTIDKDNGFVGIGTLNPTEKLDVAGSANIHHDLRVEQNVEIQGQLKLASIDTLVSSQNPIIIINPDGNLKAVPFNNLLYNFYNNPCGYETKHNGISYYAPMWTNVAGNSPALFTGVECPAKVGIGTDNPQADLEVTGNVKVGLGLEVGAANIADSKLEVHSDAIFDQKVAIGTNPQNGYDLAVCGKIWAGEVKVNAVSDWCDYVFEDDYNLKSLQEVESFIEQHKHLPEIPSAVEIETEGINVSEMLQLMMKKIEELTLYTIEQDKRINEIENSK